MELEMDQPWIGGKDFEKSNPIECKVASLGEVTNAGKRDLQLTFLLPGKNNFRKMSLWGENKNACISVWGANSDHWVGKRFMLKHVEMDGSSRKEITPIA